MSAVKNNLAAVIDPSFAGNQHLCDLLALLVLNVMQCMHRTGDVSGMPSVNVK